MYLNKKKIFLTICCLINIAGIWIALAMQINHDSKQTRKAAETNIVNLTRAFEIHVNSAIKDIDRLLLNLRPEQKGGLHHFMEATRVIRQFGYDDLKIHISLLDSDGQAVFSDAHSSPETIHENEWMKLLTNLKSREDSLFISRPLFNKSSNEWNIHFYRRISRKDGSFAGAIIATINPSFFSDFFKSVDIGSESAITLFNTDRTILARASGVKNIVGATDRPVSENHPYISQKTDNGVYDSKCVFDGVARISAFRKMQNYPLIVQIGLSQEDIFSHATNRRNEILLIGSIISAALLGALSILLWFENEQQKLIEKVSKRDEQLQATLIELEQLVTTDSLTGIQNRRSFFSQAQTEFTRSIRYNRPLSLIMIDVDHFKDVNDLHGHLVGDTALRHIAEIMKSCVRDSDILARYGGEEFTVILPETDLEGSSIIAERVRSEIEASALELKSSVKLRLTVSMGIACMTEENQFADIDKLLQEADDAMYRAKTGGRNCVALSSHSTMKVISDQTTRVC